MYRKNIDNYDWGIIDKTFVCESTLIHRTIAKQQTNGSMAY